MEQNGGQESPRNRADYRTARQASGILLVLLVAVIVTLDAFRADFEVSPLILVPILATAAAMLAVDVPGIGPRK